MSVCTSVNRHMCTLNGNHMYTNPDVNECPFHKVVVVLVTS